MEEGKLGEADHGLRSRTRDLFSRPCRKKGYIPQTTYLRTYKIGDYVDVVVNGAVHKGMPLELYRGFTGRVWNVTKRAIGVEINKTHTWKGNDCCSWEGVECNNIDHRSCYQT